ncbi:neprilysin-3 [Musca vetustissima]|uniref:neprilysin-3 n=1 Tax=Musca vetustissima TaxID=27455 RepID=UPI002AB7E635|nr:neprilysin-3 [Musca vetustissima]
MFCHYHFDSSTRHKQQHHSLLSVLASLLFGLMATTTPPLGLFGSGGGGGVVAAAAGVAVATDKLATENDILRFSYELESWLDLTKKPCEDFFGYVCARSLNATAPAQHDKRQQQEQLKFNKFLEANNDEELMDAELKVKHFYDSCQNARMMDHLKSTLMYRLSGGWPAIDDSMAMLRKRRNMTWLQVLSIFHEAGVPYFFKTQIELRSNKRIVQIRPDDSIRFTLRKFEQLSGEIMHAYDVNAGKARLVALEILNFERNSRDIMKIAIAADEKINEYTYEDFKGLNFGSVPPLDWDSYFRKVMGKPLKNTDTVIVMELPKMIQYFELLQSTTLTRFLNWLWIDYLMDKTPSDCQKLTETYFGPVYKHIVERSAINKVQMAQMYSELGQSYDQLLANTPWIDEITQQNSKLFLGRVMHLTLNGDAKLDAEYESLAITKRNFYRNLEKIQRFLSQRSKQDTDSVKPRSHGTNQVSRSVQMFMESFLTINNIMQQQQNLSAPLNYVLVGQNFAEMMIGGAHATPGAWRSTDSDRQYATFERCLARQQTAGNANTSRSFNLNNLILKLLAQQQAWYTYKQWLQHDEEFMQKLDRLLQAGHLQMSMEKLYFVASTLLDCQLNPSTERRSFLHAFLKQSKEFQQVFKCQPRDPLYMLNKCSLL